jgi:hypothetical protein
LKNTQDQTQRKESQRAAHHSIPAFRWKWVGLLKNTLKTKHKERNHKEQHITQSLLLYGGNWVGLLKNTKTKHKKGTKSSTSLNPAFMVGIG